MRTDEQIARQVAGFKNMKEWLPSHSAFGDPNHKGIDAQLDILESKKDILEFDEFNEDDFDDEHEYEYIRQQADSAEMWMMEQSDDDLFEEKP